ncbi:MAG: hypothetical protein SFY80_10565 [Verrucomicrobiota bacterium]|nr:hypothetical protein [Verrucomicrobiota bacterium]
MRLAVLLLSLSGGLGLFTLNAEESIAPTAAAAPVQQAVEAKLDPPSGHMQFTVSEFAALPPELQKRILALEELQAMLQKEEESLMAQWENPTDEQIVKAQQQMLLKNGMAMREAGREESAIRKAIADLPWDNPASPKYKLSPEVRAVLAKVKALSQEYGEWRKSFPSRYAAATTPEEKQKVTAEHAAKEKALRLQMFELENEAERMQKQASADPSVTSRPTE